MKEKYDLVSITFFILLLIAIALIFIFLPKIRPPELYPCDFPKSYRYQCIELRTNNCLETTDFTYEQCFDMSKF